MAEMESRAAERVIEACVRTESVRKCIFTSSLLACVWRRSSHHNHSLPTIVDENCWSDETLCRDRKVSVMYYLITVKNSCFITDSHLYLFCNSYCSINVDTYIILNSDPIQYQHSIQLTRSESDILLRNAYRMILENQSYRSFNCSYGLHWVKQWQRRLHGEQLAEGT